MNANELGFSDLSTKILFYKRVKWFKTFYDKNPKTLKLVLQYIYNLSAKYVFKSSIILSEVKFFMLNTFSFVIKMSCFPLIKAT